MSYVKLNNYSVCYLRLWFKTNDLLKMREHVHNTSRKQKTTAKHAEAAEHWGGPAQFLNLPHYSFYIIVKIFLFSLHGQFSNNVTKIQDSCGAPLCRLVQEPHRRRDSKSRHLGQEEKTGWEVSTSTCQTVVHLSRPRHKPFFNNCKEVPSVGQHETRLL